MLTKKILCFDMDGTIADLYAVPNWEEQLRNENPTPYLIAPPMWNMEELRKVLFALVRKGWEIQVISWLAMDSSEEYKDAVRKAKKAWLDEYDFPANKVHLVSYGTTKADCVRRAKCPAVLVDDNRKVRHGWTLGGTIDPTDGNLIDKLWRLAKDEDLTGVFA